MASRGLNKVLIIGTVGQDPEIRHMQNGSLVATISVATSEIWVDKSSGEKKEETTWHRIVAYRKLAEIIGEYVKKGSKVYIEGKLHTSTYEKNGEKRYSTDIIANEMQMLDSKRDGQQTQQRSQQQNRTAQAKVDDYFDDGSDIPF